MRRCRRCGDGGHDARNCTPEQGELDARDRLWALRETVVAIDVRIATARERLRLLERTRHAVDVELRNAWPARYLRGAIARLVP